MSTLPQWLLVAVAVILLGYKYIPLLVKKVSPRLWVSVGGAREDYNTLADLVDQTYEILARYPTPEATLATDAIDKAITPVLAQLLSNPNSTPTRLPTGTVPYSVTSP